MDFRRGGWPFAGPPTGSFTINRASPQAAGLVGWWPILADRGAHHLRDFAFGRNSTSWGAGVSWVVDGEQGPAVSFSGAGGIPCGDLSVFDFSDNFTLCAWAKPTQWVNWEPIAGKGYLYSPVHGYGIYLNDSGWVFQVREDGQTANVAHATADLRWYHLVLTWDWSTKTNYSYVDGIAVGNTTNVNVTNLTSTWEFEIGGIKDRPVTQFYFNGRITDVRLYDHMLTATEVWQLYDPATCWELYRPTQRWWAVKVPVAPTPTAAATGYMTTMRGYWGT